jgi:hypothetical protein
MTEVMWPCQDRRVASSQGIAQAEGQKAGGFDLVAGGCTVESSAVQSQHLVSVSLSLLLHSPSALSFPLPLFPHSASCFLLSLLFLRLLP